MFTKIKHKDGETVLEWKDTDAKQSIVHSLSSHDEPRPEFNAALQALTSAVLTICDLPLGYDADMKVSGVTLMKHDTMGLGCVITALKKVPHVNSPLVINTPFCTENSGDGNGDGGLWPREVALLEALVAEAERYRKGDRAQQDMFASGKKAA